MNKQVVLKKQTKSQLLFSSDPSKMHFYREREMLGFEHVAHLFTEFGYLEITLFSYAYQFHYTWASLPRDPPVLTQNYFFEFKQV